MTSRTIVTPRLYLWNLVALLALGAISFALSHVSLGLWEIPAAMIIALVKSALVALFFMHLVDQEVSNRIVLLTAVAFVAVLLTLMGLDIVTRAPPPMFPADVPSHGPSSGE